MKRNLDRQRQFELIQEDKQQQKLKDFRAMQRFRNSFYKLKSNPPKFDTPPLGLGTYTLLHKYILHTNFI